jgi:hypothetical protein
MTAYELLISGGTVIAGLAHVMIQPPFTSMVAPVM